MQNLAIPYFHAAHYAIKINMPLLHFSPTDDEGCEDATELPLQNVIANENEQLKKKPQRDHIRAVQKGAFLNCGHPSSSESTADPDKNSAVSDFFLLYCDCLV